MRGQKTGELAAFFAAERRNMIRFLKRRARDLGEMDAEDAIGDLMLSLFEKADPTAGVRDLANYIYRSLQNRLLDWLRRRQRFIRLDDNGLPGGLDLLETLPSTRGDTEAEAASLDLQRRLLAAQDELPAKQRAIWLATEIEGYTFQELSELWQEPLGTLLARKHRAAIALRQALADLRNR